MRILPLLAVVIGGAAYVQFVRRAIIAHNTEFAVLFAQVIAIPLAGGMYFAFNPVDTRSLFVAAVAGSLLLAFGGAVGTLVLKDPPPDPASYVWSRADFTRHTSAVLLTRACWVLGATSYVYALEPSFALANALINAAWVIVWLPSRAREMSRQRSTEIAATPSAVWAVMCDPSRRLTGLLDVAVAPPGNLRLGTRVTGIRKIPLSQTWRGTRQILVRGESQIVEFAEGSSFTLITQDRQTVTRMVEAAPGGSRVRITSKYTATIADGILGRALETRRAWRAERETSDGYFERLREAVKNTG